MSEGLIKTLNVLHGSTHYNQWMYSLVAPYLSGIVLDIGSGLGDIVSQFDGPRITEVIASDYNPNLVDSLSKRGGAVKNYRAMLLDITDTHAVSRLKSIRADTITCVNVLEHIPDDKAALFHMRDLLNQGGRAVILVPAFQSLYGTLDACVGHCRRYNSGKLGRLMASVGLAVEGWRYANMWGILTWFLAGRVLRQKGFDPKACHRLDKLVPVLRRMERILSPPFGQSLVMVGRAQ